MNKDIIKKLQIEELITNKKLEKIVGFSYEEIIKSSNEKIEIIILNKLASFFNVSPFCFSSNYKINGLTKISNYLIIFMFILNFLNSPFAYSLIINTHFINSLGFLKYIYGILILSLFIAIIVFQIVFAIRFKKNKLSFLLMLSIPYNVLKLPFLVYIGSMIIFH